MVTTLACLLWLLVIIVRWAGWFPFWTGEFYNVIVHFDPLCLLILLLTRDIMCFYFVSCT